MPTIHDYNLAAVQCTIGSFRATGWAEGDAISVVPLSDAAEHKVSADGAHVAMSRKTDNRHEATLKVMRGTAAFRLLFEKYQSQIAEADIGAVSALAFQVYDPIEGTKIVEANARFLRSPDLIFGASTSEAEFKLLLPNPTITGGAGIALT